MNIKFITAVFSLLLVSNSSATTLNFGCITNNDVTNAACTIAESQITLDVEHLDRQALFTFSNTGSSDAFIADIYFMYNTIDYLNFDSIINHSGVSFSEGAKPKHLPAYHGAPSFSVDADKNGSGKIGIDLDESLSILFNLDDDKFGDILNAIYTGNLVVGLHVQGIGTNNQFSESLVNTSVVPVPGAIWLFGSGLLALVGLTRYRRH